MTHWLDKVVEILNAPTADLRELAHLAGYNPKTFYVGTVIDGVDVCGQDLRGMNLKIDFSKIKYDEQTIFTRPGNSSASTKFKLPHDQVFCFTPKGRLIALPRGATAIDFAYAVRIDIGNSAVGCKINGRIAPLISELHNFDEVLISCVEGASPPAAWEGLVVTDRARDAIRRAIEGAAIAQFGGLGRQIVERAFERAGKNFSEAQLKVALPRLTEGSIDDVFIGVGRGAIYSADVVRAVHPDLNEERWAGPAVRRAGLAVPENEGGWFALPKATDLVFRVPGMSDPGGELPVRGIDLDTPVRFAPKGGAVPGERIVGILEPEGIVIYPIHSPALAAYDDRPELWLDVRWDPENWPTGMMYSTQVVVTELNEPGALGVIATTIGDYGGYIDAVSSSGDGVDVRELRVDLQVHDIQHLDAILSELRGKSVVHKVERLIQSPALVNYDDRPKLWLDVPPTAMYSTQVVVTVLDEPGALGVIATTIGDYGGNIDAVSSSRDGADFRKLRVDLRVRDVQHLNAILSELHGKSVVHRVERLSG